MMPRHLQTAKEKLQHHPQEVVRALAALLGKTVIEALVEGPPFLLRDVLRMHLL
jgi:hypothetical protein